ncbi:pirin family protein [Nafulsella turpanensis]|uniref:pirin family protein n=1 Tax=Nafulsella turpanensis TaxID=1265690 RepID=UPI000348EB97|nr:pirin family protein [Nafulsella turpanensis]
MPNRKIKKIHQAVPAHMEGLDTWRALPTREVEYLDPFLFLNHHGPQDFPPNNSGLPFGPHPHRGFETLTFVIDGDVVHQDTGGGKDVIQAGGIQWMTAGSGLIHSEVSSEEFKKKGGREEILQLWMNLLAKFKMTRPRYYGLQEGQIPRLSQDEGKVSMQLISGEWKGEKGAVESLTDLNISRIDFKNGGKLSLEIPAEHTIFFYVVQGKLKINGEQEAGQRQLVEFAYEGDQLLIEALEDAILLLGHAEPFNEPVVAHGPFVMNNQQEIRQAMLDYQSGKMGVWQE